MSIAKIDLKPGVAKGSKLRGKLAELITHAEGYSLSGSDVEAQLGFEPVTYDRLSGINSIDELLALGKDDAVIILYLSSYNSGHYTLIYRSDGKRLSFFDSYGLKEDSELNYLPFYLDQGGQPHLTRILKNAYNEGYSVDHNKYQLQDSKTDVTDCGTWCITRLHFRTMTHEAFYRLFTENAAVIKPDELLVLINWTSFYSRV